MIQIPILIGLLLSFLPSSTMGDISNEQLSLMQYAHQCAVEEQIDPMRFIKLINCESGLNKNAKGDYRNGVPKANGLLQFWEGTFNTYSEKYGIEGKYTNPVAQIKLASLMIGRMDDGIFHWKNCGLKVGLIK